MEVGYEMLRRGQFLSAPDLHAFFASQIYQQGLGARLGMLGLSPQGRRMLGALNLGLVEGVRAGRRDVEEFRAPAYPEHYRRQFFPARHLGVGV